MSGNYWRQWQSLRFAPARADARAGCFFLVRPIQSGSNMTCIVPERSRPRRGLARLAAPETPPVGSGVEAVNKGVPMPVSDRRTLSIDRESLVEWYLRNRERSRRLFDLIDRRGVLHPADCPAQPDRVLRRAPAGLQHDLRFSSAASVGLAWTSGSNSCSPAASIRTASMPPCRAAARRRGGRIARRCSRSGVPPTRRC